VCDGQTRLHRPRLVVSYGTCPPLSSSPHANSFIIGTAIINTHTHTVQTTGEAAKDDETVASAWAPMHGPPQERQKTVLTMSATPVSGDTGCGGASGTNRTIATAAVAIVGVPTSQLSRLLSRPLCWKKRGIVEGMCYERRRAEACLPPREQLCNSTAVLNT